MAWYASPLCVPVCSEDSTGGVYTGSNLHAVRALQHPRWEDYEYERADPEENSLYWLGDGQSWDEKNENGDSACSTRAR